MTATFYDTLTLRNINVLKNTPIDKDFVIKASRGDINAQATLYKRYCNSVFNTCLRMTGNSADAEDMMQESFLLAFKNIKSLREAENFWSWIKKIALNECIRLGKRKKQFGLTNIEELIVNDQPEDGEAWLDGISIEIIREEIEKLPHHYRQVFNLYAIEGLSQAEIASMLDINESTIRSHYHRAKYKLRAQILNRITNG